MYIFSRVYRIASRELNNTLAGVFNRPKGRGLFLLDVNMRHVSVRDEILVD